ncbi:uncharacterized protein LOC141849261 [Brevipalpus obovatus]|uniref:uncharacterized protein LOC141849261 n=1 Tax=Brevipalpus obovatus TaxID=246614 RepID=UPI003D9E0881
MSFHRISDLFKGNTKMATVSSAILMITIMLMMTSFTSARYLPTRSDETKKEQIKELLRLFLDSFNGADEPANMRRSSANGYEYRSANSPNYLIKRSVTVDDARPLSSGEHGPSRK